MREIRQSGSEGGGADQAALPTPIQQTADQSSSWLRSQAEKYAALAVPAAKSRRDAGAPACTAGIA